jgi:hypothetical protein
MTTQRLYTVFTALFLLLVGNVQAFWRMECRARSGVARIDPLVANGTVSEHVHVVHGSSGKSTTVTLLLPDLLTSRALLSRISYASTSALYVNSMYMPC